MRERGTGGKKWWIERGKKERKDGRREWEKKEGKERRRENSKSRKKREGGKTHSVEGWPRRSCLTLADLSLLKQGNGDSTELTHCCHLKLLQRELVTFVDL